MAIVFEGLVATGQTAFDTDIRDLQIVSSASGTYLLAANGVNGGLTVFEVTEGGALQPVDTQSYPGFAVDDTPGQVAVVDVGGSTMVLAGDDGSGAFVGYTLKDNGALGGRQDVDLPKTDADFAAIVEVTLPDFATVLITVDANSGTLTSYLDAGGGEFSAGKTLKTGLDMDGPVLMASCVVGGNSYVLIADTSVQGVSSYRVSGSKGVIEETDQFGLDQGLGANMPTALITVEAYGETWVILGASESSSLSVLRLDGGGTLRLADHVTDTLDTRFGRAEAVAVFEADGQVFVIAGGADGGMSLFSLLPGGRLLYRESQSHETGMGLSGITDIETSVTGDTVQIFVASSDSAGVAGFSMDLSDLGKVQEAGGEVEGSGKADILCGTGNGSDHLDGKGGDDVLYAGDHDTELSGGGGRDTFVLRPSDATYVINDFEAGRDRLDLSLFPMLRSPLQLDFTVTATGARIDYGDTVIIIQNAGGDALTTDQIWTGGFDWADRHYFEDGATQPPWPEEDPGDPSGGRNPPPPPPEPPHSPPAAPAQPETALPPDMDVFYAGTDKAEVVKGREFENDLTLLGGGADDLWDKGGDNFADGGAGDDTLSANGGNDTLLGAQGHDSITGFGGDDHLDGQDGKDTVWGGLGDDYIAGGAGKDLIGGAEGDDTHYGGADNDTIYGGEGDDLAVGQGGNDQVWMSVDDDTAYGGDGDDSLGGGDGDDLVLGEAGDDLLYGGWHHDTLYGGDGDDVIWSGPGDDIVFGGAGNDTVGGGDDDDIVYADAGDDEVWGGIGDDYLYGGSGNDTLDGEAGVDAFVFGPDHGSDRISRFSLTEDYIFYEIAGLSFGHLSITDSGGDAVIQSDAGEIILSGISAADLTPDSFVFL